MTIFVLFRKLSFTKALTNLLLLLIIAFGYSCNNTEYYPKPRGYIRIELPEKSYRKFDSVFPYSFEYPKYANINFDGLDPINKYWMNIDYKKYHGKIHVSYKSLDKQELYRFTEDAREMAFKHAAKAVGIKESVYSNPKKQVYGLTYRIEGRDAASPFQFYLTDSTQHFVRGALYFNVVPNNDSLQPVIDYILADINHLFETFEWEDSGK